MLLRLTPDMQFVNTDDGLVVLDEKKKQVHYIEKTGKTILDLIAEESDSKIMLQKFRSMYPTVSTEQIDADFLDFLDKLISKGIVLKL